MDKPNALEKKWISILNGADDTEMLTAMHQIRNSGSLSMLPHIINLLQKPLKEIMADHVLQFISDIRNQEAASLMVASLDLLEKTPYFSRYLSACWQSGLDFGPFILRFVDIFVRADYQTSLEAFTLIEESVGNVSTSLRSDCIRQLMDAGSKIQKEKYPLYLELIRTIREA